MTNFAQRAERLKGNAIREIFKLLTDPAIISLGGGNPARESFPQEQIRAIADQLLAERGVDMLQYGLTLGYQPLRQACLDHLFRPKGIVAELDNIITFTGSTQGISMVGEAFLDEGDVVLMENPTFLGTLNTLRKLGARLEPVSMDADGLDVEDLERQVRRHRPKLLYTIPTFQNPSGRTIPAARRQRIAQLAAEYDFLVLEDDPYGEVRFAGQAQPPIKSFDQAGQVVLMNSFSKTIAPGLRVGVACAPPEIVAKLELFKQCADTHSPLLPQAICAEYLCQGLMPQHLLEVAEIYRQRLAAMLEGLERHFPAECQYTVPEGGLFLWLRLPGLDAAELLKQSLAEAKVAFVPGASFCIDPEQGRDCLRLNYSSSAPEQISVAMERLGRLISR